MSLRTPALQLFRLTLLVMSVFLLLASFLTEVNLFHLKGIRFKRLSGTIKRLEIVDSSGLPLRSLFDGAKPSQFNLQNIARLEKQDLQRTPTSWGQERGKVARLLSLIGLAPSVVHAASACYYSCSGPGNSRPVCNDNCSAGACGGGFYCGHWETTTNKSDCDYGTGDACNSCKPSAYCNRTECTCVPGGCSEPPPVGCTNWDNNVCACLSSGGGGGGGCQVVACGASSFCYNAPCGNNGTEYCCTDSGGTHICCTNGSPIIIDTVNEGFHLTGVTEGVNFRNVTGDAPIRISWTDPQFHNAWLALDRNSNGQIDALSELFGSYTPQPSSDHPNGYAALAVFDEPKNGGNGNGIIDPGDAVYSSLRLWVDKNHDGISQLEELFTLPEAGIFAIDLHYVESRVTDAYGNQFRYKSRVLDSNKHSDPRCYDVFLLEELK